MEPHWKHGNRITLIPDSERFIPELLEAIGNAEASVWFEQYLIESGRVTRRFIDALIRAANRGVEVRVVLDSFGAVGLGQRERERLSAAGVALRHYNPFMMRRLRHNLSRNHRKMLLVDRRVAYTGGYCLTDDYLGDWFDVVVRAEGPVVEDWISLLADLWESSRTRGDKAPINRTLPAEAEAFGSEGGMPARLVHNEGPSDKIIRHSLHQRMETAEQRLWMYTPYFLPSRQLRRLVCHAAQRGVDVRLLVAGKGHDHPSVRYAGQRHFGELLDAGIRIYEYQPRFTHAKFCIVDDWVTVGSCNFDHWSLHWNLEANVEVEHADFADEVVALFEQHSAESRTIKWEDWARRPNAQRYRERLAAMISAWLAGLR
ncbi:phospholipase D-like domain-containing protein [Billgrantia kenyensis]|uniref:Phosphatidylserine/phosphatidylglycerophosphate/ cardiolipin synthase family protein n=1 Tax=Billgrantia kenyensis TaxID=321266 RepID=A0A7V9W3V7_9GAMM|nr:phospholipase D-like domain-containing protein [Halomonas kenyensis]MBA2780572.1 phosphatidylserine/phosphatidylglycerophosphate/cardiolipin synthase family protein [Halomonas kenyensis]MCG6663265.1 phosphatidylserine/phosphatidylglycerophosphate/cardiolipin synthase family protein [Halomonas kenyensis]